MSLEFTRKFDSDLKAELIAYLVTQASEKKEPIVFKPLGIKKRAVRRDIEKVYKDSLQPGSDEFIVIEANREGVYDALPEGLFHQPINPKSFKDKDEIIAEIRQHRKEEKDARKMFEPFDNQFFQSRVLNEQVEHNSLLGYADYREFSAFDEFWKLGTFLSKDQKALLLKMIPLFHKKRGNIEFIGLLITGLTGLRVFPTVVKKWEKRPANDLQGALGRMSLGTDSILGPAYSKYGVHYDLRIECENYNQLYNIISGGDLRKQIEMVLDSLLNVNHSYEIRPVCLEEKEQLVLEGSQQESYLGYNCRI